MESTGFGVSHSVYWVQEQVTELRRSRLAERRTQAERAAAEAEESGDVEAVAEAADRWLKWKMRSAETGLGASRAISRK